jgi:hypothetical protein
MIRRICWKDWAVALSVILATMVLTQACSRPAAGGPSAVVPSGPPDAIELVYFYKSNPPPCDCLAKAGENVQAVIKEEFKNEIDSGKLKFLYIASDLQKNAEIIKKYDPAPFCLGMTISHGQTRSIVYIEEIWEYLYNEPKFKEVLKTAVSNALKGES